MSEKAKRQTFQIPQAKYGFRNEYGTYVFSISESKDPLTYNILAKVIEKAKKNYDTFLPIYEKTLNDNNFISIQVRGVERFIRLNQENRGDIYNLEIEFTRKKNNGKKYLNIWCNKMELVKPALEAQDRGDSVLF